MKPGRMCQIGHTFVGNPGQDSLLVEGEEVLKGCGGGGGKQSRYLVEDL